MRHVNAHIASGRLTRGLAVLLAGGLLSMTGCAVEKGVAPTSVTPRVAQFTVAENDPLTIEQDRLLATDIVPDGTTAHITAIGIAPSNGSAYLGADGSIVYIPSNDFTGMDAFQYIVSNGADAADTSTGVVEVAVLPPGATTTGEVPPLLTGYNYAGLLDSALVIPASTGLLSLPTLPAGGSQPTITLTSPALRPGSTALECSADGIGVGATGPTLNGGRVALETDPITGAATGGFTYTPPAGFTGDDLFCYTISYLDAAGMPNSGTILATAVVHVNVQPTGGTVVTCSAICPTEVGPAQTPELSSLALFGSGVSGLAGYATMRLRARRGARPTAGRTDPEPAADR